MKGQTAMEYLMTYGWAIVVIVIVIAALAMIFTQSRTFEFCSFDPINTFTCEGTPLLRQGNGGTVTFSMRNAMTSRAENLRFACAVGETVPTNFRNTGVTTLSPGEVAQVTLNNCGQMNSGSTATVTVAVQYSLEGDPAGQPRQAVATIQGRVS